ncbi:hypothetical protein N007_04555 [Alicyclobacillus acidoterrestris ATCC 49025]|nr:hypothetical protein N007_04555 [Alicyclobacillus acidoterrestris ATCC 49025]
MQNPTVSSTMSIASQLAHHLTRRGGARNA